jgi:hypothetical protein
MEKSNYSGLKNREFGKLSVKITVEKESEHENNNN